MARRKKDKEQENNTPSPQDIFPNEMIDNIRGFGDEVSVAKDALDVFNKNISKMTSHLQNMTEAVVNINKEFVREKVRQPRIESRTTQQIEKISQREKIKTAKEVKLDNISLNRLKSFVLERPSSITPRQYRPLEIKPDVLDIFSQDFFPKEALETPVKYSERPQYGGETGRLLREDLVKNFRQLGHTLSPFSFAQYGAMFGVMWPLQLKMSESITSPVTQTLYPFEEIRSFTKGFSGISTSLEGFIEELKKSPLKMYEGIYQSKIMLASSLGGEKIANKTVQNALKLAREYPIRTEEILSSLTRLSVYPQVKPYLQDEKFQRKLLETVAGLGMIVPEQGVGGAMFSLVEALSGSWRSLQMRFNVNPEVVQQLSGMTKAEMSSSPERLIEGLHRFISKSVGLDVMEKQKYTFTKQVENFGDALQMLTKSVFESTGLYKTITTGATLFQTGFSTLASSPQFLGYVQSMFKPYQEQTNEAFAKFVGMPVSMYQTTSISSLAKIVEENFKGLSPEEIGQRFQVLIKDMSDVQANMAQNVNQVVNSAFGVTLKDIGHNISKVITNNFASLTSETIKAFGTNMIKNPKDLLSITATMGMPLFMLLGGAQVGAAAVTRFFESGTIKQRVLSLKDMLTGSESFKTKNEILSSMLNVKGETERMAFIPRLSKTEKALKQGDIQTYLENNQKMLTDVYENTFIKPIEEMSKTIKRASYENLKKLNIGDKLNARDLEEIVNKIMEREVKPSFGIKLKTGRGLPGKLLNQSDVFKRLYYAGASEKSLMDFIEGYVADIVRKEVESAYITNPKAINFDTIFKRSISRATKTKPVITELSGETVDILRKLGVSTSAAPSNIAKVRKLKEEYFLKSNTKENQMIRAALTDFEAALNEGRKTRVSNFENQSENVIVQMRNIDSGLDEIIPELPKVDKANNIRRALLNFGEEIKNLNIKPFFNVDTLSSIMGIVTGGNTNIYRKILEKKNIDISKIIGNEALTTFIDSLDNQNSVVEQFRTSGDVKGFESYIKDTQKGLRAVRKLFKSEVVKELARIAPEPKEKAMLGLVGTQVKFAESKFGGLSDEFKLLPKFKQRFIKGGTLLDMLFTGISGYNIAENLGYKGMTGGLLAASIPLGLTSAVVNKQGWKGIMSGKFGATMFMITAGLQALESFTEGQKAITEYSKKVNNQFKKAKEILPQTQMKELEKVVIPSTGFFSGERAKAGQQNIERNKGNILSSALLGTGAALAFTLLTGGVGALTLPALMTAGGLGLTSGMLTATSEYFSGRGKATEREKFIFESAKGFTSQYQIYGNAIDKLNTNISNLQKLKTFGVLSNAEKIRLKEMEAEKATLQTLQISSSKALSNIIEMSTVNPQEYSHGMRGKGRESYFSGYRVTGFDNKASLFYNKEPAVLSTFMQKTLTDFNNMNMAQQFGAVSAINTYMNDIVIKKLREQLTENPAKRKEVYSDLNKIYAQQLQVLNKVSENVNVKNQLEAGQFDRMLGNAIKNIIIPTKEDKIARNEFVKTVLPEVGKMYSKAFFGEALMPTEKERNIFTKNRNLITGVFSALGLDVSPEKILEKSKKDFIEKYASKTGLSKDALSNMYDSIKKSFEAQLGSVDVGDKLKNVSNVLENYNKTLNDVVLDYKKSRVSYTRNYSKISGMENVINSVSSLSPEDLPIFNTIKSQLNRVYTSPTRSAMATFKTLQEKVASGKELTPQEMEKLNSAKEVLQNTMGALNRTFGMTKELIDTRVNSSLVNFSKAMSLSGNLSMNSFTKKMEDVFSAFSETMVMGKLSAGFKRREALTEMQKPEVQKFLKSIGFENITPEIFTNGKLEERLAQTDLSSNKLYTTEVSKSLNKISSSLNESLKIQAETEYQNLNFARNVGKAAVGATPMGSPEVLGLNLFTRGNWNLREKIRKNISQYLIQGEELFQNTTSFPEKAKAAQYMQNLMRQAGMFGVDNTYMNIKTGGEQRNFQKNFTNQVLQQYNPEKAMVALGMKVEKAPEIEQPKAIIKDVQANKEYSISSGTPQILANKPEEIENINRQNIALNQEKPEQAQNIGTDLANSICSCFQQKEIPNNLTDNISDIINQKDSFIAKEPQSEISKEQIKPIIKPIQDELNNTANIINSVKEVTPQAIEREEIQSQQQTQQLQQQIPQQTQEVTPEVNTVSDAVTQTITDIAQKANAISISSHDEKAHYFTNPLGVL